MEPANSDRTSGTTDEIPLLLSGAFMCARKRKKGYSESEFSIQKMCQYLSGQQKV